MIRRIAVILLVGVAGLAGLAVLLLASGRVQGLRGRVGAGLDVARAVIDRSSVLETTSGEKTNLIFLHHSVGNNLIEQGGLRELFTQAGIAFWDQGYNGQGLRGPDGVYTGYAYPVPDDNTDVDGLAVVFGQKESSLPVNALSGLLQHEIIMVKSCFPNNNIGSEEKLEALKELYRQMLVTVDRHPDRLFIFLTSPPLNPAETDAANVIRARRMADWLVSSDFTGGRNNLAVVDLFSMLAEADPGSPEANMLRMAYRQGVDSHPTPEANREVAPMLVAAVVNAIGKYRQSQ